MGAKLSVGQHIKLGRVCFKVKETSFDKENLEIEPKDKSKESNESIENTDALISGEGFPPDANINQSK